MSWFSKAASETQITHGGRLWLYVVAGLVMIFLVAPTIIVIPMSFSESQYLEFPPRTWSVRWYDHYFESDSWMAATRTSFPSMSAMGPRDRASPVFGFSAFADSGCQMINSRFPPRSMIRGGL